MLTVKEGDGVEAGQIAANWDPHTHPVVTEVAGRVRFLDFEEGSTVTRKTDEITGLSSLEVMDPKQRGSLGKDKRPTVRLVDAGEQPLKLSGGRAQQQRAVGVYPVRSARDDCAAELHAHLAP